SANPSRRPGRGRNISQSSIKSLNRVGIRRIRHDIIITGSRVRTPLRTRCGAQLGFCYFYDGNDEPSDRTKGGRRRPSRLERRARARARSEILAAGGGVLRARDRGAEAEGGDRVVRARARGALAARLGDPALRRLLPAPRSGIGAPRDAL